MIVVRKDSIMRSFNRFSKGPRHLLNLRRSSEIVASLVTTTINERVGREKAEKEEKEVAPAIVVSELEKEEGSSPNFPIRKKL